MTAVQPEPWLRALITNNNNIIIIPDTQSMSLLSLGL
jgi:hypothetical protein